MRCKEQQVLSSKRLGVDVHRKDWHRCCISIYKCKKSKYYSAPGNPGAPYRALRCRKVAGTPTETPDWAMQQELRKRLEEMLSWSLLLPHKEKLLKQLNPSTSFPEDGGFLFFQQFPTFITLKMTLKGFVLRNLNSPFGVTCKQEHKSAPVCLRWISLILSKEFVFPYPVYNANV